jgi:hypothetical protein
MIRRRTGTQRRGAEECVDDYEMMGGVSNRSAPPSTGFEGRPGFNDFLIPLTVVPTHHSV